jgi:hypothetical protein
MARFSSFALRLPGFTTLVNMYRQFTGSECLCQFSSCLIGIISLTDVPTLISAKSNPSRKAGHITESHFFSILSCSTYVVTAWNYICFILILRPGIWARAKLRHILSSLSPCAWSLSTAHPSSDSRPHIIPLIASHCILSSRCILTLRFFNAETRRGVWRVKTSSHASVIGGNEGLAFTWINSMLPGWHAALFSFMDTSCASTCIDFQLL